MALKNALIEAEIAASRRAGASGATILNATRGIYVEFESWPGWELELDSMENRRSRDRKGHIEVVAVTSATHGDEDGERRIQRATVFVPDGKMSHFLNQLSKYESTVSIEDESSSKRPHQKVYDRIAGVKLAALRALWTDAEDEFPEQSDRMMWWEIWLRRTDGSEVERLHAYCELVGARVSSRHISFDRRIVMLVFASRDALASALDVMGDIAELRKAKETASFFMKEGARDQSSWTSDLEERTTHAGFDAPTVCLLDTGVNAGHPLLSGSLHIEDVHTVDPAWRGDDHQGHGTEMAGLALYGDLVPHLDGNAPVLLRHRLESVKILPPTGQNDPELYGAVIAEATSRAEIQAPDRVRVYAMAVTSIDGRDRGQPTSWSAAVDALACGRSFDSSDQGLKYFDDEGGPFRRLFVVSAGNVDPSVLACGHLDRSDVEPVEDPAQAWNALTVGAFTEKAVVTDPDWANWSPVAEPGELSPWSTTSVAFQSAWPVKPDVVFEGGNVVKDAGDNVDFPCDDLCMLTTHYKPAESMLISTWATSAATALAAQFCATVSAEYPQFGPETVRALVVHSARWTNAMQRWFDRIKNKGDRLRLVRRYGFGVPDLSRALRSASNAATLIIEDSIRPFLDGKMREIHLHDLPWPVEVLESLADVEVRVRVTLSYFVEPNPGRLGWKTKHRYQSHGLRFEMKRPTESVDEFRKRINQQARGEDEKAVKSKGESDSWFLGPNARSSGSIHSDVYAASGAKVAECGTIAVYPVAGWWKEIAKADRSEHGARYALIVTIETDEVGADLWTPIANQVDVATAIEV